METRTTPVWVINVVTYGSLVVAILLFPILGPVLWVGRAYRKWVGLR